MPPTKISARDILRTQAYDLLYGLGLTINHEGFLYISVSVVCCMEQPELLRTFTRDIYPKVSGFYHVDRETIDIRMRKIVQLVWYKNSDRVIQLAGRPVKNRPAPAQFVRILCDYLTRHPDMSVPEFFT